MTRETTCGARTVAVVAGGANGLGHELAILYARSGYDLVLIDRDSRLDVAAETLEKRFGVGVTGVCQDLAEAGAIDRLASLLAPVAPSIRVILSRAGYRIHGPFSPDDLRAELATVSRDYIDGFRPDRPPGLVSDGGRFLGSVRGILPGEDQTVLRDAMAGRGRLRASRPDGYRISCPSGNRSCSSPDPGMDARQFFVGCRHGFVPRKHPPPNAPMIAPMTAPQMMAGRKDHLSPGPPD